MGGGTVFLQRPRPLYSILFAYCGMFALCTFRSAAAEASPDLIRSGELKVAIAPIISRPLINATLFSDINEMLEWVHESKKASPGLSHCII